MDTPVLLIVFNRLETAKKTFKAVRDARPKSLFIAADGPRRDIDGEDEKCENVRKWLVSNVDWECEVHTLFQKENIGCGLGPSTAISWFFDNVDAGIILEDDCVPHPDFFQYSTILLHQYAYRDDIYAINSSNFQKEQAGDGSYYFSMQNGPFCAWATWRRAWKVFDYTMIRYSKTQIRNSLFWYYHTTKRERDWWLDIYDELLEDRYNGSSWDYQYIFAIWANRGKSVVPNSNLSTNIGFGPEATHTKNPNSVTANCHTKGILPLVKPTKEHICRKADLYYHDFYYGRFVKKTSFVKRIKMLIKLCFKFK